MLEKRDPTPKQAALLESLPEWAAKLKAAEGNKVGHHHLIHQLAMAIGEAQDDSPTDFYQKFLDMYEPNG